ncbi:unnamed protein product [Adineta ricciae]|uniref:Retrotransposon gag domain-containing protein n=1 Tax=Adineta ricciae TaxID=249248 RepID=A0A815UAW8_ADIRI|nr:unnamed protein product [Adineta ricciae]CAF1595910.1 unnamed protein product [Adineta ricciae]
MSSDNVTEPKTHADVLEKDQENSSEETPFSESLHGSSQPKAKAQNTDRRQAKIHSPYKTNQTDTDFAPEENEDEESEENKFDEFILNNFMPFSGAEDILNWLDETDKKFRYHKISRNIRYKAIPLLVTDDAKRTCILNESHIKTYDDFYKCLWTTYHKVSTAESRSRTNSLGYSVSQNNDLHMSSVTKNISFHDPPIAHSIHFDDSDSLPPRPILRSTTIAEGGTAKIVGDEPVYGRTFQSSDLSRSTCSLEQTTYVIHKAIIDNLINNPKTFQGGKDDVKQWLEDVEQLFDTAQIPDSYKLDLIPYSLRGEARRWYKNTKASLTSWPIFVKELKEAFLSPFHDELAFKKLDSYTQGINQPVRSFYNEVLKLCNETDLEMSESMKLRHLLKKAKPTLQYEIRKRKPTTTKQFLEYGKEAEELLQLSNLEINSDPSSSHDHKPTTSAQSTVTAARTSSSTVNNFPFIPYDPNMSYNNFRPNNRYNNNRYNNNRNYNYNSRSNQSPNPFGSFHSSRSSFPQDNSSYHSTSTTGSNQRSSYSNSPSNYNTPPNVSNNQHSINYQPRTINNTAKNNPNSVHSVNHILAIDGQSPAQLTPPAAEAVTCAQYIDGDQQASACSHF